MPTVYFDQSTAATFDVVAAPAGNRQIVVLGVKLMGEGDCKVSLRDGAGSPVTLTAERVKDGGGSAWFFRDSSLACTPGTKLTITLSAAVAVYGHVEYVVK